MPDTLNLMSTVGTGRIVVTFFGAPENGIYRAYSKHTMDQRRTTAAVMKDIIDAKAMAKKHVRKTHCPVHVDQQTHESPFGGYYTQPLLRVTAVPDGFEPVPDDEWEPWMGPGGQYHEDYRWSD